MLIKFAAGPPSALQLSIFITGVEGPGSDWFSIFKAIADTFGWIYICIWEPGKIVTDVKTHNSFSALNCVSNIQYYLGGHTYIPLFARSPFVFVYVFHIY